MTALLTARRCASNIASGAVKTPFVAVTAPESPRLFSCPDSGPAPLWRGAECR